MKAVSFKHNWNSNLNEEDEMKSLFGEILVDEDTSQPYETEQSMLFKEGAKYTWIDASGCSCWEGDWDGWELTKTELKKLATERWENRYDWRDTADALVAKWVMENL